MNGSDADTPVLEREAYSPHRFVDRESETSLVEQKIQQARDNIDIREPLVNFWGVAGQGKSWLLQHLCHLYGAGAEPAGGAGKPTCAVYCSLADLAEPTFVGLAREMAAKLAAQVAQLNGLAEAQSTLERIAASGSVHELATLIGTLVEKCVPVILLDGTEDFGQWQEFEKHLLEPILATDRVLVVIAGRRKTPRWRRVEVRRRAVPAAVGYLRPFDAGDVQELLGDEDGTDLRADIPELFAMTGGNPLLVYTLAHVDAGDEAGRRREWIACLKAFETDATREIDRHSMRYIDALVPLRSFRTEALHYMLKIAGLPEVNELTNLKLLRLLRDLDRQTNVIWWEEKVNAYTTDEIVRTVKGQRMLLENQAAFVRRHRAALDMYWERARTFPENSVDYLVEILYHQVHLERISQGTVSEISNLGELLRFAEENLVYDHLLILPERIRNDVELGRLLTTTMRQRLVKAFTSLLEKEGEEDHD